MAISRMTKIVIAAHRTEAAALLDTLQETGLYHIVGLDRSTLVKEYPELAAEQRRLRDTEDLVHQIDRVIQFLGRHAKEERSFLDKALSPRVRIDERVFRQIISDEAALALVDEADGVRLQIETLLGRIAEWRVEADCLEPWRGLALSVEELRQMEQARCITGMVPVRSLEETVQELESVGALVQVVGRGSGQAAVLLVALNEQVADVRALLRKTAFDEVDFSCMQGRVDDLIAQRRDKIATAEEELRRQEARAAGLAGEVLKVQVLGDHYGSLLAREQARNAVPVTEETVLFEGWVRARDLDRLRATMDGFRKCDLVVMERGADEDPPVAIDNPRSVRPFEVITRLYGMPQYKEVDPTALLAPFFIVFFALCLTDAAYGLLLAGVMYFVLRRTQGDKRLVRLLCWAGLLTIVAGVLTGGWFGTAVRDILVARGWTGVSGWMDRVTLFDPMQQPMVFFVLAIALGYFQIMSGLVVALVMSLSRRDIKAALFDQVSWLVMLNSLVVFALSRVENPLLPHALGSVALPAIGVSALAILLFSHREGGIGGRLGMGAYNLFSTVFYLGDVLSYLRLMALGLATAGVAMAVNVIAETSLGIPYVGIILALLLFVVGHAFNIAMSSLGAFVHTMRLQFVEFFPKFLVGGGEDFKPLTRQFKHVYVARDTRAQHEQSKNA